MNRALPSNSLAASIRVYFGLTQAELASYLGVSEQHLGNLEAGRRRLAPLATLRLARLSRQLPPPEGFGAPAPPPLRYDAPAPAPPVPLLSPLQPLPAPLRPGPLQQRQRQCQRRLALIGRDLYVLTNRAAARERRAWALPLLMAALAPSPTDPAGATAAEQEHARRWLATLVPLAPADADHAPTALALLLTRRAALEAEVATLAELLAASSGE